MADALPTAPDELEAILDYFSSHPDALEPGTAEIRRVDTHISAVLLTDTLVFKFKKPVKFPFLDQRGAVERLQNCEREATLNRRLAPDVYLGLQSVRASGNGFSISDQMDGCTSPCVVMRRLAEETSLASHVQAGRADALMMERIGATLADFHANAQHSREVSAHHAFAHNLQENLDILSDQTAFQRLRLGKRIADFHQSLADVIEKRNRTCRVVDGHGDLRLDHIYIDNDAVRIIDCVEFSPEIRAVDPYEDIAFTSMALRLEGRPDLAERFITAYASSSTDMRGLRLLRLFEIYRATVRAKIDVFSVKAGIGNQDRYAKRIEAYLRLCDTILKSVPIAVRMFVVSGLPATGKSTRALALSRRENAVVLSSDVVRKRMGGAPLEERRPDAAFSGAFQPKNTARIYRRMTALAGEALRDKRSVILDATFSRRRDRDRAKRVALRAGAPFALHFVEADPAVVEKRLEERKSRPGISDLTDFETWKCMRDRFERPGPDEPTVKRD